MNGLKGIQNGPTTFSGGGCQWAHRIGRLGIGRLRRARRRCFVNLRMTVTAGWWRSSSTAGNKDPANKIFWWRIFASRQKNDMESNKATLPFGIYRHFRQMIVPQKQQ
eukprot:scaffold6722_cov173-Amphora_coffeaeformis.AAC.7